MLLICVRVSVVNTDSGYQKLVLLIGLFLVAIQNEALFHAISSECILPAEDCLSGIVRSVTISVVNYVTDSGHYKCSS